MQLDCVFDCPLMMAPTSGPTPSPTEVLMRLRTIVWPSSRRITRSTTTTSYLGKVNKKANDQRDADRKLKADSKRIAAEDFSDLQQKFVDDRADPYDLLVLEFEPNGEKVEQIVSGGKENVRKVTEKQDWGELCPVNFGIVSGI